MNSVKPAVGQILHFYLHKEIGMDIGPKLAMVSHVWSDTSVNISLWDSNGTPIEHPPTNVHFRRLGEPLPDCDYCEFPPAIS